MRQLQENKFIIIIFILLFFKPLLAMDIISTTELIEKHSTYNGKTVLFKGEAIGDKMAREGGVWINLLDSTATALGIFFKSEDANKIKTLGEYKAKGDIVIVKGIFYRACQMHKGEIDFHADSCQIIKSGYTIDHPINFTKLYIAIFMVIFSLILIFIWRRFYRPKLRHK